MRKDISNTFVRLSKGNTQLIPYQESHHEQTVEWLNDNDLQKLFGLSYKIDLKQHRQWLQDNPNILIWAILSHKMAYIGNILLHIENRHHVAYLQMYIGNKSFRRQGHGRSTIELLIYHVFTNSTINRIWLHTLTDNPAAIALYKSVGFQYEGTERQALKRDAGFLDQMRWSLIKQDFSGAQ